MTQIKPENIKRGDQVRVAGSDWATFLGWNVFNRHYWAQLHGYVIYFDGPLITAHRYAVDFGGVRPGACFRRLNESEDLYYVGDDPVDDMFAVVRNANGMPTRCKKTQLTRHPDGDIGEQKDG